LSKMSEVTPDDILAERIYDTGILASILILITLLACAAYFYKNRPMIPFCTGLFICGLLPVSNIVPQLSIMNERYLYISSIAACLIIAYGFERAHNLIKTKAKKSKSGKVAFVLLILLFLFLSILYASATYSRNRAWQNKISLYVDTIGCSPTSVFMHLKLADAYQEKGMIYDAIQEYLISIKEDPGNPEAHNNLGTAYSSLGMHNLAIDEYKAAIEKHKEIMKTQGDLQSFYNEKSIVVYQFNLALIYIKKDMFTEAEELLQKAMEEHPSLPYIKEALFEIHSRTDIEKTSVEENR